MKQSKEQAADPLEGYRRTPDEYEQLESELQAFRVLAANEVNIDGLRSVIFKDELRKELRDASSTLARLVTHAISVYEIAQQDWVGEDKPDSEKAVAAHSNARAARLVMDWVAEQIEIGLQAQRELEAEANE